MVADEKLKTIVDEVIKDNEESIVNNDINYNIQVYNIIKKIIDLPSETTTTIADLINYNPKETFIEPLTQGRISRLVKEACKKLNIELEKNRDCFGGLAFYYQFKKVDNKNELKNIDIEDISKELIFKIQNLEDNVETSISALLNRDLDSKTMFSIYDLVVEKLKEVGLYLDFGIYENQRVGLPFNIPFKKGYAKNIRISSRTYNGDYGKGSIFEDVVEFTLAGGNATIKAFLSFCIDEKIKDNATLKCSVPFCLNDNDVIKINNLINELTNKYQPCNADTTKTPEFSIPKYLKYIDLSINGINYAINSDDEILSKLKVLIKCDVVYQTLSNAFDTLVK